MAGDSENVFRDIEGGVPRAERILAWKRAWGLGTQAEPGKPKPGSQDDGAVGYGHTKPERPETAPAREKAVDVEGLAESIARFEAKRAKLRTKFALDRNAVLDQVTGERYSTTRRSMLEALSAQGAQPNYLSTEYGMRTARDDLAGTRSGPRIEHEASSVYMRDNPGSAALGLFKDLYEQKTGGPMPENVFFINNPNVIDKIARFYGTERFPGIAEAPIDQIAPGIFALTYDAAPMDLAFFGDKGKGGFTAILRSLGSTPSSYQGVRALHETDAAQKMARESLGTADAREALARSPAVDALRALPEGHAMQIVGKVAADLLSGLPGPITTTGGGPSLSEMFPGLGRLEIELGRARKSVERDDARWQQLKSTRQQKDEQRVLQSRVATGRNEIARLEGEIAAAQTAFLQQRLRTLRHELGRIDPPAPDATGPEAGLLAMLTAAKTALTDAERMIARKDFATAAEALALAENKIDAAFAFTYDRDPMVKASLEMLSRLAPAMEALANDELRATRIFDLMIDELYILLARTRPYDRDAFDKAVETTLKRRAPSIGKLENASPKSFMVSSGMDSVTTGLMAAMKNHPGSAAGLLGGPDTNENYFEVAEVLRHNDKITDSGDIVVATLNPSTPTAKMGAPAPADRPPDQVDNILARVRAKLSEKAKAGGGAISLVLDATIETGEGGAGESELERLIAALGPAIDAGALTLVLCKSYQKYASLGSAKVMAGNVTVIATDEAFAAGNAFAAGAEADLDFRNNDESQLLVHMLEQGNEHELAMVGRAAANAATVADMFDGAGQALEFEEGLPFLLVHPSGRAARTALFAMGVEERDSFGFQNSSCLQIPAGLRINPGQDSAEALTEKFHAVANLMMSDRGLTGYGEVRTHIQGLDADDPALANKTASALALASVVLPPARETSEALASDLKAFIDGLGSGAGGTLTPEMQARLTKDWVRHAWTAADGDTAADLIGQMEAVAARMPYKETRAAAIVSALPAAALAKLDAEADRLRAIEALCKGLDLRSRLATAEALVDALDYHKADAMLKALEKPMEDMHLWAKGDATAYETLASGGLLGDLAPEALSPEEREALWSAYATLRKRHEDQADAARPLAGVIELPFAEKAKIVFKADDRIEYMEAVRADLAAEVERQLAEHKQAEADGRTRRHKPQSLQKLEEGLARMDRQIAEKRTALAMSVLLPGVDRLIADKALLAAQAEQDTPGLGDALGALSDALAEARRDVDLFLSENAVAAKPGPEKTAFKQALARAEEEVARLCTAIGALKPDLGAYASRTTEAHLKAELERVKLAVPDLVSVAEDILPMLQQIEDLDIPAGNTFVETVKPLLMAKPLAPGTSSDANKALTALQSSKFAYRGELKRFAEQIIPLLQQLPD